MPREPGGDHQGLGSLREVAQLAKWNAHASDADCLLLLPPLRWQLFSILGLSEPVLKAFWKPAPHAVFVLIDGSRRPCNPAEQTRHVAFGSLSERIDRLPTDQKSCPRDQHHVCARRNLETSWLQRRWHHCRADAARSSILLRATATWQRQLQHVSLREGCGTACVTGQPPAMDPRAGSRRNRCRSIEHQLYRAARPRRCSDTG